MTPNRSAVAMVLGGFVPLRCGNAVKGCIGSLPTLTLRAPASYVPASAYFCGMVRKLIWIVAGFALVVVALLAWLGAFKSLTVNDSPQGGYVVVGYDYMGPFEKIGPVYERVVATGDSLGISTDTLIGVYYSNPDEVVPDSLLSFVGIAVGNSDDDLGTLDFGAMRTERIPAGRALWIDFPYSVRLGMYVGIMRAYDALGEAAAEAGLEPGWVYEIHTDGNVRFVFQEYPQAEDPAAF